MNNLLIKVTRSILDLAYARGHLPKDPHSWFTKQRKEKPDVDPFSFDEMVALLEAFKLLLTRQEFVNGRLTILKTEGSRRNIDMLPSVEEAMRQQLPRAKATDSMSSRMVMEVLCIRIT